MVQMNVNTSYNGKYYQKGKTYDNLPKEVEKRWTERKLAIPVKSSSGNQSKEDKNAD